MEVFRIFKPGIGWAQCLEFGFPYCHSDNNTLLADAPLQKVSFPSKFFIRLMLMIDFEYCEESFRKKLGIFMDGAKLEQLMLGAGFIDVSVKKVKRPIGPWGSTTSTRPTRSLINERP